MEFTEKSKNKQLDCDLKVKLNGIKALFNTFSQIFANSNWQKINMETTD